MKKLEILPEPECNKFNNELMKLNRFVDVANDNKEIVYIYGSYLEGCNLLQCANISEKNIKCIVDSNAFHNEIECNNGIEIITEDVMRENQPDYLLIVPSYLRDEVIKREDIYLENGGKMIFLFPNFEIYSKKQKVVVTGSTGMIAKYVIDEYFNSNSYSIYGFARNKNDFKDERLLTFYFDIKNVNELEMNLNIIKPDIIVHLAGVSSTMDAFENPINTLEVNGMSCVNICEIIHKNGWNTKFFNASSSEIYKGHINYEVSENDINMYHCHPYSISKIMSHSMVSFYRTTYNLPFYNGVIFTVEPKVNKEKFLLKRIAEHAKKWKDDFEPIIIGHLESYRTLLHVCDAAKAIKLILDQPVGDDYIICGDETVKMINLVVKLYKLNGIEITQVENNLCCDGRIVAIIKNTKNGIDEVPVCITSTSTKLKLLGWSPKFFIGDILNDILNG
jgi:GDPmannose 4,6-dehydratase